MEAQLGGGPSGGVRAADPGADGGADGGGVPRAGPAWRCTAEVLILIAVELSDMSDSPLRLLRKFDMKRVPTQRETQALSSGPGRETYGVVFDALLSPGGAEAAIAAVALEPGGGETG